MSHLPPRPLAEAPRERLAAISLLATDVDGTMTREGRIPPAILSACEALMRAGVEVMPVTGRSSGEALGLARYLPGVKRAIAENGAVLVVPDAPHRLLLGAADRVRLHATAREIVRAGEAPLEPAPCEPFRLADVAFERAGRNEEVLVGLRDRAAALGVRLVWSSVHVHLSLHEPDKGRGLSAFAEEVAIPRSAIAVVGDAPNDAGFWSPGRFGLAVGTAEVWPQRHVLPHLPEFSVGHSAGGWLELASAICAARA